MSRLLTALFFAFFFGLLAIPLLAQAGECGVGGTAKDAAGAEITKTDAEAKEQNARIGEDGYWWTCPAPKYIPPVQPKHCIPSVPEAFRTWTVDGRTCTTADKYATGANDRARDRVIHEGRFDFWVQWIGPMRGELIERCEAGVRRVIGATCAPVAYCNHRWSTLGGGGKVTYVYDARQRPVPIGQVVMAKSPSTGREIPIVCTVNGFARR